MLTFQEKAASEGAQSLPLAISLSLLNLFILSSSFSSRSTLLFFPTFRVKDGIFFLFSSPFFSSLSLPLSYCHRQVSLWNLRALQRFMPRSPVSSANLEGSEGADCQSGGAEEGLVTGCTLTFLMVLWKNAQLFSLMHRWCWPNHLSHKHREQRRAPEVFGELTEVRTSSGGRLVPRQFITPLKNYKRATLATADCKAAHMRLAFIANTSTSHVYYILGCSWDAKLHLNGEQVSQHCEGSSQVLVSEETPVFNA